MRTLNIQAPLILGHSVSTLVTNLQISIHRIQVHPPHHLPWKGCSYYWVFWSDNPTDRKKRRNLTSTNLESLMVLLCKLSCRPRPRSLSLNLHDWTPHRTWQSHKQTKWKPTGTHWHPLGYFNRPPLPQSVVLVIIGSRFLKHSETRMAIMTWTWSLIRFFYLVCMWWQICRKRMGIHTWRATPPDFSLLQKHPLKRKWRSKSIKININVNVNVKKWIMAWVNMLTERLKKEMLLYRRSRNLCVKVCSWMMSQIVLWEKLAEFSASSLLKYIWWEEAAK